VGAKERREREREDTRDAMVRAVRDIAAADGWQAVSIRKIAELTEYSPTLLYQYFVSKEAIIHEVRRLGYDELLRRMQATAKSAQPRARLRALAVANVEAAFDQPEVFKAMLGMDGTPCDPPPGATAHIEIGALLHHVITAAAPPGTATATIGGWTEAFYAAVQGVVTMYLNDLLPGGRRRAIKTVEQVADGLTAGWFGTLATTSGRPAKKS
jgi:AcrR family transcriptional regulator